MKRKCHKSKMSGGSIKLKTTIKLKKPNQRVDHYWREVFKIKTTSGETKYNQLQKVVKSVLSLQNANAAVS